MYTKDKSKALLVRVVSGEGRVIKTYGTGTSTNCPSGYTPPIIYNYIFNISFIPIEDIPYYTVEIPYISNGVTKYRTEKRYYEFFPLKRNTLDNALELRLINRIRILQYETLIQNI